MHTHRGEQVRVGGGHDRCRGPAGREPGDVDPALVDPIFPHHLPGDPGDQRRLAAPALLVVGHEPVPAFLRVGRGRLLG